MQNIPETQEPSPKLKSLGDLLRVSCESHSSKVALLVPEKDGGYKRVTYRELWELVKRYASGLRALGLRRGDRICIISENSSNWAILDWAGQALGLVVVPIYSTLPADQVQYIVRDCEASIVFCGDLHQTKKLSDLEGVRTILINGTDDSFEQIANEAPAFPEADFLAQIDAAKPEDVATIIYTSGTTGLPKGVMLCHKSFIWMNQAVLQQLPLSHNDTFFAFLPLSHVFARANDHFLPISLGATIGYCRNVASLGADMLKVSPTVMLVVPRLLDAVRGRILEGVKKQKPLNQRIFQLLLTEGKKNSHGKFSILYPLLYKIAGSKVKSKLSPNLRFMVSGGAALPRDIFDFYHSVGIPIQQGYGLTETTSGIYVNNPDHVNRPDTVGEPLIGVETKFANDGEILVRGPFVMKGYYKLPAETANAIDDEGWFHTGDVGELDGNRLKITDRKKDLIVLGNGKNVAPQPIEAMLKEQELIEEAVVLGDGEDSCFALIVPNYEVLRQKHSCTGTDVELAQSSDAKKYIKEVVQKVNSKLASHEAVKRFALISDKFSIESGELTPTLKVKRKVIVEKYRPIIDDLLGNKK